MIAAVEKLHLQQRQAEMNRILADPTKFKACEHCKSISRIVAGLCWVCHAYVWVTDPEEVCAVAKLIGSTPFPFLSATVPRSLPAR